MAVAIRPILSVIFSRWSISFANLFVNMLPVLYPFKSIAMGWSRGVREIIIASMLHSRKLSIIGTRIETGLLLQLCHSFPLTFRDSPSKEELPAVAVRKEPKITVPSRFNETIDLQAFVQV